MKYDTYFKTPNGMHWHNFGDIWYLINQNFGCGYPHTIVGYVSCRSIFGEVWWHAVYSPDTILNCIGFETRQEAQRALINSVTSRV